MKDISPSKLRNHPLSKSHMYMHCQGITLNTIFIITSTHHKITMQRISSPILHDESLYPIYNVAIAFCVQHVVLLSVFVLSQKAFIFTLVLSLTDAHHERISRLSPDLTKPLQLLILTFVHLEPFLAHLPQCKSSASP